MRLVEYEQTIKKLIENDKNDPQIYNNIQQLTYYFLIRKKVCKSIKDIEDISFTVAADLYMKILAGEEFTYIMSYLERIYRDYVRRYYRETGEVISLDPSIETKETILGKSTMFEYNYTNNKIYLKNIGSIIDSVMKRSCKYKRDSVAYLNLKSSVALSLIRGTSCAFHLDPEQEYYLKIVLSNFYNKVKEDGLGINDSDPQGKGGYRSE